MFSSLISELFQFSSVAQLCPTFCNPMDCSTPGSSIFHYLPSLFQFMSIESVMLSNQLILCCPLLLLLQSFPASGSFPMSRFFTSGGQSTGASASVLPMNIQSWFPLGLVWSPCCPRDSEESYAAPQFKSINSSALSLLCVKIIVIFYL